MNANSLLEAPSFRVGSHQFTAGFGFAVFVIYGWQVLYEVGRHRSMLEYPTPEVNKEFLLFSAIGAALWIGGTILTSVMP